ncbi:MAG TPA: dipicolinate synthase subunit DpsA [Clostridia bacterium]|jgi:dipicolinate synthase subunit A|nr:dipicolinate synthase subunit DpsA [Clostridia bacterium]
MRETLAGINIAVIGGDERELVLIQELIKQGANVKVIGFPFRPELEGAKIVNSIIKVLTDVDVVVLPMSGTDIHGNVKAIFTNEKLIISDETLSYLKPGTLLLVGAARPILRDMVNRHKLKLIETANIDKIAILNSIPTAEGAIQIAMEKLPITIHNSKALVLGLGRCGATLAGLLNALGAHVYVAVRKEADLARGFVQGYKTVTYPNLTQYLPTFDVIFNTVPALILDSSKIALLNRNCLIIDIASSPGGVDFSAAEKLGIQAILAPGLPGKVAPKTAGQILADYYPGLILQEIRKDFRRCNDAIER